MTEVESPQMRYVKRIDGNVCGPHQVKLLYYRNIHPSWRIKIFVDHNWIYNGEVHHEGQTYILEPNAVGSPAFDVLMGCPIPGPTMQEFKWDIVRAEIV